MGKNILEYKGYVTKVTYDVHTQLLSGKVEGIVDAVTFECADVHGVERAFHDAVDHYLAFCENVGRRPAKAYKGQFNVRIDPKLHRAISLLAAQQDETLSAAVEHALQAYVDAHQREAAQTPEE